MRPENPEENSSSDIDSSIRLQVTEMKTTSRSGVFAEQVQLVVMDSSDRQQRRQRIAHTCVGAVTALLLLFCVPIWWPAGEDIKRYVGSMADWAFMTLFLSGVLSCLFAYICLKMWKEYTVVDGSLSFRAVTVLKPITSKTEG